MDRSRLLAQLTEELETVKAEMEERGEGNIRIWQDVLRRQLHDGWIASDQHQEESGQGQV